MFSRKKWEYYSFKTDMFDNIEKSLNDLGSMGYELVSAIRHEKGNYSEFYLKREK